MGQLVIDWMLISCLKHHTVLRQSCHVTAKPISYVDVSKSGSATGILEDAEQLLAAPSLPASTNHCQLSLPRCFRASKSAASAPLRSQADCVVLI